MQLQSMLRKLNPMALTKAVDPDRGLQAVVTGLIEAVGMRHALGLGPRRWKPGQPLKLILAGYNGTRNTGADVRVEELTRQLRHLLGDDQLELSVMSADKGLTGGYFRACRQVHLPHVYPKFLFDECPRHDGVVACEGSMFKSKFANALSTMMAGALGMATAEGKLSVGYGAEAGHMDANLKAFVERHCRDSLVLCRNEPSREVLGELGIRTTGGTDTAWTFSPAPPTRGEELLRAAGWDGERKLLAVCPINPFWWPVRPDLVKFAGRQLSGQFKEEHYKSIYFHHRSEEATRKHEAYLDGIAGAVNAFRREVPVQPILVGMEQLDRKACEALAEKISGPAPLFISDEHDMFDLVSVLRRSAMMISSRFHAIVCSMPGLVPSGGITMDERIHNLMHDRGHEDLFLRVDDGFLEERLLEILRRLHRDSAEIATEIGQALPGQLQMMGAMGIEFLDELCRVYPEFPRPERPRSWEHHLPKLAPELEKVLEQHG